MKLSHFSKKLDGMIQIMDKSNISPKPAPAPTDWAVRRAREKLADLPPDAQKIIRVELEARARAARPTHWRHRTAIAGALVNEALLVELMGNDRFVARLLSEAATPDDKTPSR